MTNAEWFLLVGGLLLAMGLGSSTIRRSPVTSAMLYLAVGLLFGPMLLGHFHFNPLKQSALLEVLAEAAVLISLFAAGVKMPVPVVLARWRTPIVLATASMTITVGLVGAFGYFVLDLPVGAAILLGAIVAPTDPVLATDIQTRHPGDRDRLRFYLTCEAGMNDGTAFPFVMLGLGLLGLHELGDLASRWLLLEVVWATAAGILLGVALGASLGRLGHRLRNRPGGRPLLDDFLGLGLIGVVYGSSELIHAWGFLAVFFAGVALRQTELRLSEGTSAAVDEPAQMSDADDGDEPAIPTATVSEGSLVFKEHLERLSELVLVLLVAGALFPDSWSWRAVGFAAFLFLVARPISVMIGMADRPRQGGMAGMIGWFGVRGIGSLYYLMYAIEHGLPEPIALELIHLTLIVITLSILVHGVSATPLMNWFRDPRSKNAGR